MNAKETLLTRFKSGEIQAVTLQEACKILSVPYRERKRMEHLLDSLVDEGALFYANGNYGTKEGLHLIEGTLIGNERGFAFLSPSDKTAYPSDFFIPHRNLRGAMHGDTVLVTHVKSEKSSDEAEVVCILQRGYTQIVGSFYKERNAGYLYPDEKKYFEPIFIPLHACKNIRSGVKAVAKITDYPYGKAPGGEIIEVLGDEEDFDVEELSIIRSFSLREDFPEGLEAEANRINHRGIKPSDLNDRTDFRGDLIVTIDGEDTRDIDDAVSVKKEGNDYLLSVHIADVSHYVPFRSPLDNEAYARGTSVYFPDRVLPMLPKGLSNGICSLSEGEERLTLSCVMKIDAKGVVKSFQIVNGIIRSTHRMTYNEISDMLDGDREALEKYADVQDMVSLFAELTRILQKKRESRGSIELDVAEAHISIDENGDITIPNYDRPFSHQIIEQFMVTANETVASFVHSLELPFLYRIHEKPSPEKASDFRSFAQGLGLSARYDAEEVKPYDFSNLLKEAKGLPIYSVLNRVMLRSMQKARYSALNTGHFGLASDCYCHFTSPIRRYPDLCIHRIIKEVLSGEYEDVIKRYGDFVSAAAIDTSERERRATEAEREVDALYIAMYMSEKIGEEYDAVVSGVTNFGIFAELPFAVEGMIPLDTLRDEFTLIPDRFLLQGYQSSFSIGQPIRVRVEDVDFFERRVRFSLIPQKQKEEV